MALLTFIFFKPCTQPFPESFTTTSEGKYLTADPREMVAARLTYTTLHLGLGKPTARGTSVAPRQLRERDAGCPFLGCYFLNVSLLKIGV